MSNEMATRAPLTIGSCLQSKKWEVEVLKVLPKYLTVELMLRVARSVAADPKFARCTPESFLSALLKCGRAGLVPDGRNAHLIPFGNEVQAIFDWKGLVAMAGRNGVQVTPKLVHRNDTFRVQEDDGSGFTKVVHEVDFSKPRGDILLVYSRAKSVKSDEVDYEFMTAEEVENVRQTFSRAKDSLMWTKAWGEGAKKTVIRRHSKRWDLSPEDRAALMDDDDAADFNQPIPVVTSRPIFETPKALPKPEPEAPGDEPQPDAPEQEPEPTEGGEAGEPQPELLKQPAAKNGSRYLKAVRALCGMAHIKEGELMDYLGAEGVSDGSPLDELDDSILKIVSDNWSKSAVEGGMSIVAAVTARRKGGVK